MIQTTLNLLAVLLALLCLAGQQLREINQQPGRTELNKETYLRVYEWYDASLRDDDVAKELVQPGQSSVSELWTRGMQVLTPRRSELRAASDGAQYAAPCCRALRCPPARGSQQQDTQVPPRGILHPS